MLDAGAALPVVEALRWRHLDTPAPDDAPMLAAAGARPLTGGFNNPVFAADLADGDGRCARAA